MSGFIFILNQDGQKVSESLMDELVDSLYVKGPDRKSVHIDNNVGLGHTLFKTTFEAEYDRQPVSLDGSIWIVSSARIDGRDDLVRKLGMSKKIDISKTPDSEFILYAYQQWGEKCTKYLIGDFAFVIWDKCKKKVFCARDQFGMRQLYYAEKNNYLIVSNSLNTMMIHPGTTKELNKKSMGGFLLFGDHIWLDKSITVFKDIKTLRSAHNLTYNLDNKSLKLEKYWALPLNPKILKYKRESEYIEHFNELFEQAIKDRLRAPSIGIAMSGGMDSTAIAATAMGLKEKSLHSLQLQAVTAVYDHILPCQERFYSKQVSEKIGIPIHYIAGDNYKMLNPYMLTTRPLQIPTLSYWLDIQKTILNYSKSYLHGGSADNLLDYTPLFSSENKISAGSIIYQMLKMRLIYKQFPSFGLGIKKYLTLQTKHKNNSLSNDDYPTWLNPEFENLENLQEEWRMAIMRQTDSFHKINPNSYSSILSPDWGREDLLMSPVSVLPEAMDPFLDVRLVEYILSVPSLPWLYNKHILRRTMAEKLPKSVTRRPKTSLGNLENALMMQTHNKWTESWEPSEILAEFIVVDKAKYLLQKRCCNNYDLKSRLIYLEKWLLYLNSV